MPIERTFTSVAELIEVIAAYKTLFQDVPTVYVIARDKYNSPYALTDCYTKELFFFRHSGARLSGYSMHYIYVDGDNTRVKLDVNHIPADVKLVAIFNQFNQ